MTIKPLDDRVVIKQCDAEAVTAGGIVLPESAKEKPQRGKIAFTGPGRMLEDGSRGSLSVKVGDEVFYGKYAGTEVEIDQETYTILRESEILAVLE